MKSYVVRAKCKACNGEFTSLGGMKMPTKAGQIPEYNGETFILFRSESYVLTIFTPFDLVSAAEFLGVNISDFADESLVAFCHVLATVFLDWTADVIAGDFREDIVRDPMIHRSGLDSSILTEPVHEKNRLRFFVHYNCDVETRIANVEFDFNTQTFEQNTIAAWKSRKIIHVGDDGQVLRVS